MTVPARRSSLLLVFVLACCVVALALSAQHASASAYHSCPHVTPHPVGQYGQGLYLKELKVKGGPSCAGAKKLVKAYYKCRTKGSKPWNGTCHATLSGYSCYEHRYKLQKVGGTLLSYYARVNCAKGSRHVFHRYQQFNPE